MLDLHKRADDYVLVLDYYDDVIVCDSATDPSCIWFYQIKTRKGGSWTLKALTKRDPGSDGPLHSILGRLYRHYLTFASSSRELAFVSNASCNLKLKPDNSTTSEVIRQDQLDTKTHDLIVSAITEEFQSPSDTNAIGLFRYVRCPIDVDSHDVHALGRLTQFLDEDATFHGGRAPAFFRALKQEISRATNYELSPQSFEALCQYKGITRARFQQMLDEYRRQISNTVDIRQIISLSIANSNLPIGAKRAFVTAFNNVYIAKMDSSDVLLDRATRSIMAVIQDNQRSLPPPSRATQVLNSSARRVLCKNACEKPVYPGLSR